MNCSLVTGEFAPEAGEGMFQGAWTSCRRELLPPPSTKNSRIFQELLAKANLNSQVSAIILPHLAFSTQICLTPLSSHLYLLDVCNSAEVRAITAVWSAQSSHKQRRFWLLVFVSVWCTAHVELQTRCGTANRRIILLLVIKGPTSRPVACLHCRLGKDMDEHQRDIEGIALTNMTPPLGCLQELVLTRIQRGQMKKAASD